MVLHRRTQQQKVEEGPWGSSGNPAASLWPGALWADLMEQLELKGHEGCTEGALLAAHRCPQVSGAENWAGFCVIYGNGWLASRWGNVFGFNVGTESKQQNISLCNMKNISEANQMPKYYSWYWGVKKKLGMATMEVLKRKTEEVKKPYEIRHGKKIKLENNTEIKILFLLVCFTAY